MVSAVVPTGSLPPLPEVVLGEVVTAVLVLLAPPAPPPPLPVEVVATPRLCGRPHAAAKRSAVQVKEATRSTGRAYHRRKAHNRSFTVSAFSRCTKCPAPSITCSAYPRSYQRS